MPESTAQRRQPEASRPLPRLDRQAGTRRRRNAEPTAPNPRIMMAQVEGSAPVRPRCTPASRRPGFHNYGTLKPAREHDD